MCESDEYYIDPWRQDEIDMAHEADLRAEIEVDVRKQTLIEASRYFSEEWDGQEMHGSRVADILEALAEGREYRWGS